MSWRCRLVLGFVGALIVAAVPGGMATGRERVKISYMFWGGPDVMERDQRLKAEFEAENPGIEVELLHSPDGYGQKLRLLFASGTAPDTYALDHQDVMEFVLNGWAADLTPYARRTPEFRVQEFLPPVREIFTYQGREYGYTDGVSTNMYFFNVQLFTEAGLETPDSLFQRGAWNWAAFRTAAVKLTRRAASGRAERVGAAMHIGSALFRGWIWSNGGDEVDDGKNPTKALFDTPESILALQFIQDVIHRDQAAMTGRDFEDSSLNNTTNAFLAGRLGLYARWISAIPLHGRAPFEWGMAPYPQGPSPQGTPAVDLTAASTSMAPSTRNPEAAWKWIVYKNGPKGIMARIESGGGVPSRRLFREQEIRRFQPGNFVNPEILFLPLTIGRSRVMSPNQGQIFAAANPELNKIFNNQVPAAVGAAEATRLANAVIAGRR